MTASAASPRALNERYGKLDILIGNAALGGSNSPLDHFQPKEWDEVMAVNVTANWHLIRHMHPLLLRSDAGRVVFLTSGAAANPRAYRGLYSTTKAALETMARTYANETVIDADPGQPVRAGPDADPDAGGGCARRGSDDAADRRRRSRRPSCRSACRAFSETGKIYDYRAGRLQSFRPPA